LYLADGTTIAFIACETTALTKKDCNMHAYTFSCRKCGQRFKYSTSEKDKVYIGCKFCGSIAINISFLIRPFKRSYSAGKQI